MSRLAALSLGLAHEHSRRAAAIELARRLRCDRVFLFVRDIESGAWTEPSGMPWAYGRSASWQRLLDAPAPGTIVEASLRDDDSGAEVHATATRVSDSGAFVTTGGQPTAVRLFALRSPLALAVAAMRGEAALQHRADLHAALDRAHEAAQQAGRVKDDFLATLSHELRTPLNAILGWLQLLRVHIDDAPERTHALDVLERNARTQAQIVADLLDVSRAVSGRMQLSVKPMDLARVVREAVDPLLATAQIKGVALRIEVDDLSGTVRGDADRMRQVVWNLASNAVKFTPPGGEIRIRLTQVGHEAVVEVRDSGVGIEPDVLPYIFERFRQGDSSLTRRFGGLGLGLAIVHHLVELHGGSVQASSEGSGRGATFVVRVPMGDRPAAGALPPTSAATSTSSRGASPSRP